MITYDVRSADVLRDPYPHYAQLRTEAPVYWVESGGFWAVSRYADAVRVLNDPATFSSAAERDAFPLMVASPDSPNTPRALTASDPPVHTLLRKLVVRGFTPRTIEALYPRILEIATELVAGLVAAARQDSAVDYTKDFAELLPGYVIADMLDLPRADSANFREWSNAIIAGFTLDAEKERNINLAREMHSYFAGHVEKKKEQRGDDVVSLLLSNSYARPAEDSLSDEELAAFCALLMVAGNETTTNLLSNWIVVVATEPALQVAVRSDADLLTDSFEESLRYDAPVQALFRVTARDVEIGGVSLAPGEQIGVLFGSANRDPDQFGPDADRFLLGRTGRAHIAFGHGIHFCLGAALTRLEARASAQALFAATSGLHLAAEPTRMHSYAVRGCLSTPITLLN
jgi:cytochrome P450